MVSGYSFAKAGGWRRSGALLLLSSLHDNMQKNKNKIQEKQGRCPTSKTALRRLFPNQDKGLRMIVQRIGIILEGISSREREFPGK
jgi:hypothetical protein